MRRAGIAVLCLLLVTAGGCSSKQEPLSIERVPQEEEVYLYTVSSAADGSQLGEYEFEVKPTTENGETVIVFASKDGINGSEMTVVADAETLMPKASRLVFSNPQGSYDIKASYTDSKVEYQAITPDGEQQLTKEYTYPVYDNNQLLQLIRFLPLKEGYEQELNIVNIANAREIPAKIVVTGVEDVTVMGQTTEAFHVELRFIGGVQHAWYQTDGDRPLLRYDNGQTIFELKEP